MRKGRKIGGCERRNGCKCARVDARSIAECSKESLCVLGTQPRDATREKEEEINTCYPVAEVFPSGWSENVSLYAKRNSPEARAASDFNREPIYRSDGFLEFFVILNRFIDINAGTAILTTIGMARIKCSI